MVHMCAKVFIIRFNVLVAICHQMSAASIIKLQKNDVMRN